MIQISKYIEFANTLADLSETVIKKYFRNFGQAIQKSDLSPVTVADREAEQVMRQAIEKHFPEHGIIGEEFGIKESNSSYYWVLDPIDGTASFIIGRPMFGTLIALVKDNDFLIGIINQPILHERWLGVAGQKSVMNKKNIHASNCTKLSEAIICTTGPQYFKDGKIKYFDAVRNQAKQVVYGGDCYNYGLLACGFVDIVIESSLKFHDFAALIPVLQGAGAMVSDWQGNQLNPESNGDILIAATKELHEQALALLNQAS